MMSNIILFLLSLVMFFGTGCSHTVETQDSVPAENDLAVLSTKVRLMIIRPIAALTRIIFNQGPLRRYYSPGRMEQPYSP